MRRAKKVSAHLLLSPELLYSPPNDAIVNALLEEGYEVHIYAPNMGNDSTDYGDSVQTFFISYSWKWIFAHILDWKWKKYDLYSGTSEDPLGIVGLLSFIYQKPSFSLVDEIKSGSYRGDRSEYWKRLCKWGIRRSVFKIVNDSSRVRLLAEYVGINKTSSIMVYPGCFKEPIETDESIRDKIRSKWGFPAKAVIIGSSGGFNMTSGADWLIRYMNEWETGYTVIQPLGVSDLSIYLLGELRCNNRMYVEKKRLSWQEAWIEAQGLDIGICIYTNPAPQFQHMGVSSNRLCMFIAMGVPVIASKQESFGFIEEYNCGRLVSNYMEFYTAIEDMKRNLDQLKMNCKTCLREYIRPSNAYKELKERIRHIKNRKGNFID